MTDITMTPALAKSIQRRRNQFASVLESIPASLKDDTTTDSAKMRNGKGQSTSGITIREGITGFWENNRMVLQFDTNRVDGFTRSERRYVLKARSYDPNSYTVPDGLPASVKAYIDGKEAFEKRNKLRKAREQEEETARAKAWLAFAKTLPTEYVLPKAHSGEAWAYSRVDIEYPIGDDTLSVLSARYMAGEWSVTKATLVLRNPNNYAVGIMPRLAEGAERRGINIDVDERTGAYGTVSPSKA